MSRERLKKASATEEQSPVAAEQSFIRLVRVKVPNSYHAAYQIEKVTVVGDKVTNRKLLGNPDLLQMILAKSTEALNPESVHFLLEPAGS